MNINHLSQDYIVKKLEESDVEEIYQLQLSNPFFFACRKETINKDQILNDLKLTPSGFSLEDKYFIGFYNDNELVAIMDFLLGFPTADTIMLGLFMIDNKYSNQGVGSKIITDAFDYFKILGYKKIRIGIDKNNPQSNHFWHKIGFREEERKVVDNCPIIIATKKI